MKTSQIVSLVACMFFARVLPPWLCLLVAVALEALAMVFQTKGL